MNSEKWNPHKAIELADQNLKLFGPPEFKATLDESVTEDLPYDEIRSFDNGQLEALFVIYGGYKAYLETKLSDDEALLGALESTHTEACNIAIHNIAREYDNNGKRKPTKEELRGDLVETTRVKQLERQNEEANLAQQNFDKIPFQIYVG